MKELRGKRASSISVPAGRKNGKSDTPRKFLLIAQHVHVKFFPHAGERAN
jgi:hypothetical protein